MKTIGKAVIFSILILHILSPPENDVFAQANPPAIVTIFSPQPGDAVQGFITITGSIQSESVVSYRLEFSFVDQPEGGWFLIQEGKTPLVDQTLGGWDTSAITDGDYQIRVTVSGPSGDGASFTVNHIRVRNYSPIETSTPVPAAEATEDNTLKTVSQPTETPLSLDLAPKPPKNPAALSRADLSTSLKIGGVYGALIFIAYILVRWLKIPRN
jgi:hypothetical protein